MITVIKSSALLTLTLIYVNAAQNTTLVSTTRSAFLDKYKGYADAVLMHFTIPQDVSFISLKFVADEMDMSIFGCPSRDVSLYLKHGSPPVINPDGSKFPDKFYFVNRQKLHNLEFKSDKVVQHINISDPIPGTYYATIFLSYTDPREEGVTQEGLTPECYAFVDAALYSSKPAFLNMITPDKDYQIELSENSEQAYKMFVPDSIDRVLISLKDIKLCTVCTKLTVSAQSDTIPNHNNSLWTFEVTKDKPIVNYEGKFWAKENSWHYVLFKLDSTYMSSEKGSVILGLRLFSSSVSSKGKIVKFSPQVDNLKSTHLLDTHHLESKIDLKTHKTDIKPGRTDLNPLKIDIKTNKTNTTSSLFSIKDIATPENKYYRSKTKMYRSQEAVTSSMIKEYNLLRESSTESFKYSFDIDIRKDDTPPLPLNLTSKEYTVLKFTLQDMVDIGGTLQFIMAFKPRIVKNNGRREIEKEPANHVVIACIRNGKKEMPEWPNKCGVNGDKSETPLILNSTSTNSSILLPYPEAGNWFVSLKLYCEGTASGLRKLEPCNCPDLCKKDLESCLTHCEKTCKNDCNSCGPKCEEKMLGSSDCKGCNCDGPFMRSSQECETSVLFDISSTICVRDTCGKNGRCTFMVAEGFVYTVCVCLNNYRGWDCMDDSHANSFAMIVLELLLLVLSNIPFLVTVYFSYRRKYYVECIVYFSTFFFSTFYHACDAGENIISFCIVKLPVLQFSDFFCGLFSIWVTLIAMAYLSDPWRSMGHIAGAIMLAFGTTLNKQSLWVFLLPSAVGLVIMCVSWFLKYRKNKILFPAKRYLKINLPIGLSVVIVGLLCFALLQTKSNYKYVHSLWHMLMAVGVIILLPDEKTFLPKDLNELGGGSEP